MRNWKIPRLSCSFCYYSRFNLFNSARETHLFNLDSEKAYAVIKIVVLLNNGREKGETPSNKVIRRICREIS